MVSAHSNRTNQAHCSSNQHHAEAKAPHLIDTNPHTGGPMGIGGTAIQPPNH